MKIFFTVFILFSSSFVFSKETKKKITARETNPESSQDFYMEIKGPLKISNPNSGYIGIKASSEAQGTVYNLPTDGSNGQFLTTDGSSNLNWITLGQSNGSNGQFLTTDGSGTFTWTTLGQKKGTNGQFLTTDGNGNFNWNTLGLTKGENGQVLTTNGNGTYTWTDGSRPDCPSGFDLIGTPNSRESFCISSRPETATTWIGAIEVCYEKPIKSHLCSASEWAMSCISSIKNKEYMTGHWEWVSDSGSNYGRIIGLAGCDSFNGAQIEAKYQYRCCFR